jgi:membrane protease YdiL (CAAX protease family)
MFGVGLMKIGRVPSMKSLGWRWEKVGQNITLGLLGFILCMAGLFLGLLVQTGSFQFDYVFGNIANFTITQRLSFFAIGILGAAIVEESFYRGYLQPAMIYRFGTVGGIIATAIIFDLAHMNFKPAALVSKLVSGLVFGFLRGKDGSLMAPAIAHALFWFAVGST